MTSNGPRSVVTLETRVAQQDRKGGLQRGVSAFTPRVLAGVALVLAGAVAGLAAGQSMANRSAYRVGACIALNVAAALGYLDAEQQRRVRHALATAINPDADLFAGRSPRMRETCAAADG